MAYTAIDDPSAHFQTVLYTGNGSDDLSVTFGGNSDLQPDMLWFKNRNDTQGHEIFDSTRGVATSLRPHNTDADNVDSPNDRLMSFDSDGFELDDDGNPNTDTNTYVAWGWKANGGSRTTFAEDGNNPAGGRQVNATAGFSIIDYTGTGATGTIAHGLGAKPDFWVIKNRGGGGWSWYAYHGSNTSAPETELLYLSSTDATLDTDAVWNDTAPTSSVFTVNTNGGVNDDDNTYICYLFTSIQGYSKFGSYTANGNSDGPFIYTGFRPAWIMVKCSSRGNSETNWVIWDNKRDGYNVNNIQVFANKNFTEGQRDDDGGARIAELDILSNGFKHRDSTWGQNGSSGDTYIYMAFAEQPFVTSGGVPCTAR